MKTEKNIKALAKLLIDAADLAETIYDDPDIKGREQRRFGRIFNLLHKEWWALCVHYDWFGIPPLAKEKEIKNDHKRIS